MRVKQDASLRACAHCDGPASVSYRSPRPNSGWRSFWSCERCGLEWCSDPTLREHSQSIVLAASDKQSLTWRPSGISLAFVLLVLLPFALGCLLFVPLGAVIVWGSPSIRDGLIYIITATLAALFAWFSVQVVARIVLLWLVPVRLRRQGDQIELRAIRDFSKRTSATFSLEALAAVELRPWQLGLQEVWLVHREGAAFRVTEALTAEEAEQSVQQIRGLLT